MTATESDVVAGAIAALRRRAARQRQIARDGTALGERGVVVRKGEAAIAERLAGVLSQLADEFEALS
jgi:hypothetical protein